MAGGPEGFGSRWQTVGGLRLHALESAGGQGTPVILLPGLVTASRSMVPLARALAAHGIRVSIVSRLPRIAPPVLGWHTARRYLAAHAAQYNVSFAAG